MVCVCVFIGTGTFITSVLFLLNLQRKKREKIKAFGCWMIFTWWVWFCYFFLLLHCEWHFFLLESLQTGNWKQFNCAHSVALRASFYTTICIISAVAVTNGCSLFRFYRMKNSKPFLMMKIEEIKFEKKELWVDLFTFALCGTLQPKHSNQICIGRSFSFL